MRLAKDVHGVVQFPFGNIERWGQTKTPLVEQKPIHQEARLPASADPFPGLQRVLFQFQAKK